MLGLGWNYKWGCLRLLVMQGVLLVLAITTLRITGYGIDLIHSLVQPSHPLPQAPWGLAPPQAWPPLGQIAFVASLVLLCELLRGGLNYAYALTAGALIHTRIVPELRSRVYDKLQRLSFRFFDSN